MCESLFIFLGLDPRKSIHLTKNAAHTSGSCSPISQLTLLLELLGNSFSILYLLLKCGSRVLGVKEKLSVNYVLGVKWILGVK